MEVRTEDEEQIEFVQWMRRNHPGHRIFAIPNGGARHPVVAAKMKAGGVSKGVPDLFIPSLRLFIEMKRTKGGTVSPEQKEWIEYLTSFNYMAVVFKGCEEAKNFVNEVMTRGKVMHDYSEGFIEINRLLKEGEDL